MILDETADKVALDVNKNQLKRSLLAGKTSHARCALQIPVFPKTDILIQHRNIAKEKIPNAPLPFNNIEAEANLMDKSTIV